MLMYQCLLCHVVYSYLGARMLPLLTAVNLLFFIIRMLGFFMHQA